MKHECRKTTIGSGSLCKARLVKQFLRKALMGAAIFITCLILAFILGYVMVQGVKGINLNFLTTKPSYLSGNIGILPDILNTVYLLITAIVVLLPLGVGAAVYLNEYAGSKKIVKLIDFASEILSGIPSIIYGLVGMLFFCQFLKLQTSILAGALTLVMMNLPTIMRTTKESLISVQNRLREGAYGLGASKWIVVKKIVIPECLDGIITGCILSAGRILGESAALLFTAGFAHTLHGFFEGITSSGATLTVSLYVYAKEQGDFQTAFSIAVILLVLAVLVNISAEFTKYYFREKRNL